MMEERMNAKEVMARVGQVMQELKKSDAYPAVVGGIAGGLAGALMAVIIAGRSPSRSAEKIIAAPPESRGGIAARDIMQLLAVIAPLLKQAQAWLKEREK